MGTWPGEKGRGERFGGHGGGGGKGRVGNGTGGNLTGGRGRGGGEVRWESAGGGGGKTPRPIYRPILCSHYFTSLSADSLVIEQNHIINLHLSSTVTVHSTRINWAH